MPSAGLRCTRHFGKTKPKAKTKLWQNETKSGRRCPIAPPGALPQRPPHWLDHRGPRIEDISDALRQPLSRPRRDLHQLTLDLGAKLRVLHGGVEGTSQRCDAPG